MGKKTSISWTDKTLNFWRGCTKVSPGCKNCYMFTEQLRYGQDPHMVIRTKTWGDAAKWQKQAAAEGKREMVFTCSWSDFFHADADKWRDEAWKIMRDCPNLIWQVLTKRAERMENHLPKDWGQGYPNVWLGVSVENDDYVERAGYLRAIPATVRFISYEPALGPLPSLNLEGIDWVIYGAESGSGFRLHHIGWAADLYMRCKQRDVAFFYKQGNGLRSGMEPTLHGQTVHQFPTPRLPMTDLITQPALI